MLSHLPDFVCHLMLVAARLASLFELFTECCIEPAGSPFDFVCGQHRLINVVFV